MSNINNLAQKLLENGFEPIPIAPGKKYPTLKNWSTMEVNSDTVNMWKNMGLGDSGVGIRTGKVFAIDVDVDDKKITEQLVDFIQLSLGDGLIREGKPGRALLVYRTEKDFNKKKINLCKDGKIKYSIEVLGKGQQFVAFGVHPDTQKPYRWLGKSLDQVNFNELVCVTEENLAEVLEKLHLGLSTGWTVGKQEEIKKKVVKTERVRKPENQMTLDEIIFTRALDNLSVWVPEVFPSAHQYQNGYRISSKDLGRGLEEDIQIFPEGIQDFGEEGSIKVIDCVAKFKFSYDKRKARTWLMDKLGLSNEGSWIPDWLKDWVYVMDSDRYYQCGSSNGITEKSFNANFGRFIEASEKGKKQQASQAALQGFQIPVVQSAIYDPRKGKMFEWDGKKCVNTFNPNSLVRAADTFTEKGKHYCSLMDKHIQMLCGGENKEYRHLLDWIAFNVQYPGYKITWAPLIKGTQGTGKTTLGKLLEVCLGRQNVKTVNPEVVMTPFNSYAENHCVVFLEELHIPGHSRYDIANALKPLITNDTVDIHCKGRDSYNSINTTNYIAFTNRSDAMPVEENDRRWFVVFSPWRDMKEMMKAAGCSSTSEYFTPLYEALETHADELCKWLLEHPISEDFDAKGEAPYTLAKESMRAETRDDSEELIRDLLRKGGKGYNERIISLSFLIDTLNAIEFEDSSDLEVPSQPRLRQIIRKLGYSRYHRTVSWKGKNYRIYLNGMIDLSLDEVREMLDNTCAS